MTQERIMFLESHPERAAPLSRRDNERRHAVGLLILLKLCPIFTFLQQLTIKGL